MSYLRVISLAACLAAALLLALPVFATQTDNHGIHAVPAPGPVTIDGSLEDWDLSGQTLMCYDIENLRGLYSAQVAMMYDPQNLYVSLHWKDPHPMVNHHDPHYQADKGWAADAVQLRFKTDEITHVTAWYYSDGKQPAMQIEHGKGLTDAFGGAQQVLYQTTGWKMTGGAEMAFREDPDHHGYVQEIKLPWTLITAGKPYRAGDSFNCGVELLWGTADWPDQRYADNLAPGKSSREFFWTAKDDWGPVFLEPQGQLHLPTPPWLERALHPAALTQGPIPIAYTLPQDARVTVVVEDEQGRRIRNLVPALDRKAGPNVEHWDGLDDSGKVVSPGTYRARILYHDPIHLQWELSFANPGNPTWNTPDGRGAFYGDHTPPHAAAAAGNFVALACPIGEAGTPLIGCDLNGQRLWGQANRQAFQGGIQSLATDGKVLWVAAEDTRSYIYRVEIATGKYAPWNQTSTDAQGNTFRILDLPVGHSAGAGKSTETLQANPTQDPTPGANLRAIAYRNGILAICLSKENVLELVDADTGAVKSTIAVPHPVSVVTDRDGAPIVLSEGKLLRFPPNGAATPFTAGIYPDGQGLAMDAQGLVYLSVRGQDQDVKVFSPSPLSPSSQGRNPGGLLLREIGKRGGRPSYGAYDPEGMLNPAQIAVDSLGRLWVTEENDNPKRTSVWDTRTGKLVKDLVGTCHYSAAGSLDPFDPTLGFADNTVYRLDWKTGESRPVYSLARRNDPADLFPPVVTSISRVVRHGNNLYVYTTDSARGADEVECTLFDGKRWRSVAHLGQVHRKEPVDQWAKYASPLFEGHDGQAYAWADKNGDGLVQPDELSFASPAVDGQPVTWRSYYWGQLPGPDGRISYVASRGNALLEYPVAGYTPCGAPIYDIARPEIIRVEGSSLGGGNGEGMVIGGSDGRVYLNQDPILEVDRNGRVLGSYPSHFTSVHGSHQAKAAHPGYIIGPSSFMGTVDLGPEVGEVFDLNGNLGEHYLFTSDGMLVQSLFKDVRGGFDTPDRAVRGMSFDDTTAGGESFGGNFIRTRGGRVYLTIGGTDARVLEVTGLQSLRRLAPVSVTVTPADSDAAVRIAQENTAKAAEPKIFTVTRLTASVTIDGKPEDWPELMDDTRPALEIQDSPEQRYGRVDAKYDDQALYLAYRVFAPRGAMKNSGQDTRLLFKTGDAVDLMLGPESSPGGEGNLRLLMTVAQGQPTAILYRKVVPGTPASERVPFAAPWHNVTFDQVRPAPEVKLAVSPVNGGYFVEARVPWSVLGVTPRPGLKLRGDVGILFADNGGTTTVSRQYWSNKATGLVNDVPGEADLTPDLWGTLVLQP